MNDYFSRREVSHVDRGSVRASPAVPAVAPVSAGAGTRGQDSFGNRQRIAPVEIDLAALDEDAAGAAEYAKVHARIADILADLRADNADTSVESAAGAIQSMLPAPIIIVPLPPASKEAVEQAVRLAKRIAAQGDHARMAQAHLKRGTVDHILSAVA